MDVQRVVVRPLQADTPCTERDADRRETGVFCRFLFAGRPVFGRREMTGAGRGAPPKEDRLIARPEEEKVRVNQMIRARQVRVIDDDGNQLGIMSPVDAIREAEDRGLDLVEVAGKAIPPVCRIMDYGKFRYQQSKRAKESKKHQHTVTVKEIKYRPKIDVHDFDTKTNHVRGFLSDGDKVKITIMFRGREMAHPEFGREILGRVVEATKDLCQADCDVSTARLEGRNMCIVLSPTVTHA